MIDLKLWYYEHSKYLNELKTPKILKMPIQIKNHTQMSLALKNGIEAIYEEKCVQGGFRPDQGPCPYMNMIWLHHDGEDDPDIENIGPVTYTPFRGFPGYFYPYRNQRGYLSPIVMVQLKNPMPGVRSTELEASGKN